MVKKKPNRQKKVAYVARARILVVRGLTGTSLEALHQLACRVTDTRATAPKPRRRARVVRRRLVARPT